MDQKLSPKTIHAMKIKLEIEGEFESRKIMAGYINAVVESIKLAEKINEPWHSMTANDSMDNTDHKAKNMIIAKCCEI